MRHNPGLLISGILHILIMAIPVSMAVVKNFDDVELFVMTEGIPALQEQTVVKQEKTTKPKKIFIENKNETEEPKKNDETPKVHEQKIIETTASSDKTEAIQLPLETANPPEIGVRERSSAPQSFASNGTSDPRNVQFGTATGPKFLHREMPVYPLMARKFGKEGKVVLRLTIDHRGNLLNVEVTQRADYGFTEAAIEAVKRSTFLPAKRDGYPIISRALLPIRFTLLENTSPSGRR